jgi:hypothetical protein
VETAELVKVRYPHTTLEGPTEGVCECKMDGEVYMDSYLHGIEWIGSCFMVTWIVFKNHLLEVGITQNHRETMARRTLTTVGLFYILTCEDPLNRNSIEIKFGWGPGHIWLHTTFEGMWPHYMILEVSRDGLKMFSLELSQFHGHGSWLVCEVGPSRKLLPSTSMPLHTW